MYGWPKRYCDVVHAQLSPRIHATPPGNYGPVFEAARKHFGRRLRQGSEKWRTIERILIEQEMFFLCLRPSPASEVRHVLRRYERAGFQNVRQRIAFAAYLVAWAEQCPTEAGWVASFVADAERRFRQMPQAHPKHARAAEVLASMQTRLAKLGAWPAS